MAFLEKVNLKSTILTLLISSLVSTVIFLLFNVIQPISTHPLCTCHDNPMCRFELIGMYLFATGACLEVLYLSGQSIADRIKFNNSCDGEEKKERKV